MALKGHCRKSICFAMLVCFLGSLLVAPPASHFYTCQFPSSQICNACSFLWHSRIRQHTAPTALRAFSVSSSYSAHNVSNSRLQQYLAASNFPQHLLSTSFAEVCLQWEISPWIDFPGTVEGGFPTSYRGPISRKSPHEAS